MQEAQQAQGLSRREQAVFDSLGKKYLPYWPLYLVLVALFVTATYFYLRYQVPLYQANATLLIKDDNRGGSGTPQMVQELDAFEISKSVENEIEVIRSRKLAKEVVRNLHLYAMVAQEGRVNDYPAYTLSPISIQARFPDSIRASGNVYFTFNAASGTVVVDGKTYQLDQWYRLPYGELMFTRNKNNTAGGSSQKDFYFSMVDVKSAANDLLSRLSVLASSGSSSVLKWVILDLEPKRAEDILNEWIDCYNRAAVEDKNVLAANTLRFIEERLKYVMDDLDSVEHRVERFKAVNKLVDISAQGQMFLENVSKNDQQLSDINLKMVVLRQVEDYVRSKNKQAGIVPATLGVEDPVLMQLLNGLYEAETQYEKLKKTTAENHPSVGALAGQITKMRGNILENIANQRRTLDAGRAQVFASNSKYSSLLASLPSKERELVDINRQQAIKNNIYTFLLQKREETALSSASAVADSRIVDVAESNYGPILSNSSMMYTMAVLSGLLLGIGLVTLKGLLSRTLQSREDLERETVVPLLGEVAHDRSGNIIVIGEGKRSFIAEQFRYLRTYLSFLGINEANNKILVTSSIPGEGKSFTALNLGISLALTGKRVVLLELDLRMPFLSASLNRSDYPGVSNFLIGQKEIDDIVAPTDLNENLFIVPSGPIPPNPSELLMNGRLKELLEYAEQHFDCVIVDTAPVGPVTDAFILMPLCNVTLYVVRQGYTPKATLQRLDEIYQLHQHKNMAVVFNGVKPKGLTAYKNTYEYGYGQEAGRKEKKRKKVVS
ncbi:polysaccharide biosynthesis tyrosine autokinase [Paraflavisolibacter sp. H34]|uniref:GumC family protein n=1 Tax=Huijunlia imazamoxiresistens TaxID=3127457 RepID=UPI00301666C2